MRHIHQENHEHTSNKITDIHESPNPEQFTCRNLSAQIAHDIEIVACKEFGAGNFDQDKAERKYDAGNKGSNSKVKGGIAGDKRGKLGAQSNINTC